MSQSINSLTKTPKKRKLLYGPLRTSYKLSARRKFEEMWEPYRAFGIQPNDKGVQVYHQPQGAGAIRMLAEVLLEVARRLEC